MQSVVRLRRLLPVCPREHTHSMTVYVFTRAACSAYILSDSPLSLAIVPNLLMPLTSTRLLRIHRSSHTCTSICHHERLTKTKVKDFMKGFLDDLVGIFTNNFPAESLVTEIIIKHDKSDGKDSSIKMAVCGAGISTDRV